MSVVGAALVAAQGAHEGRPYKALCAFSWFPGARQSTNMSDCFLAFGFPPSLVSQRHHGINHGRPACGKIGREQSGRGERQRSSDEGEGVERPDSVKQT